MKKLIFLPITVILIFVVYFLFIRQTGANHTPLIPVFSSSNQTFANLVEERLAKQQPFNLLLLGYGGVYGGVNHDGAYLTDSLILVQINPLRHTISLISLPRDLWVKIPSDNQGGAYAKINSAYAIGIDDTNYPDKPDRYTGSAGAGNMVKDVVTAVSGFQVDRFIALDFSGFSQFIDTLGGIDVTLAQPFDDLVYPVAGQEIAMCGKTWDTMSAVEKTSPLDLLPTVFPCRFEHLHLDAGLNHLDGTTALKFVRSRHSLVDGTDFGRSQRQRQLITAVVKKTLSLSAVPKFLPLYQTLRSHLDTDLSIQELASAATQIPNLDKYQITGIALTDDNILVDSVTSDGQAILLPQAGQDNWASINAWLANSVASPSAAAH